MDPRYSKNEQSADDFGWSPDWFGLPPNEWGDTLCQAIESFQNAFSVMGDEPGVVGWPTFLRMWGEYQTRPPEVVPVVSDYILIDGQRCSIPWDRVVSPDEHGALTVPRYYYEAKYVDKNGKTKRCKRSTKDVANRAAKSKGTIARFAKRKQRYRERKNDIIDKITWHWDVTYTVASTAAVLTMAGYSSHFGIAWDGTIFQFVDVKFATYHSGVGLINETSVGVDLNSPITQKRTDKGNHRLVHKYAQPERPVEQGWKINGWNPGQFLGYHPEQLEAAAALWAGLNRHLNIPFAGPHATGKPKRMGGPVRASKVLPGAHNHSDVKKHKWDACIDCAELAVRAKEISDAWI